MDNDTTVIDTPKFSVSKDNFTKDALKWIVDNPNGDFVCACRNKSWAIRIAKELSGGYIK